MAFVFQYLFFFIFVCISVGLLAVALEPYFTGKVPDILVVPVSFTYDRILEELLHSREMLGIPKPKESTSVSMCGHKWFEHITHMIKVISYSAKHVMCCRKIKELL